MIFPESNNYIQGWCRIHVLFARTTHKAVILRRGPSLWTQQIAWDTNKKSAGENSFEYGQWLKGRIDPLRCDISPSGSYLLYFCQKYHLTDPTYITFTAVSKIPHFTALALWPTQDSWSGGGYFKNDTEIIMWHRIEEQKTTLDHPNTLFKIRFSNDVVRNNDITEKEALYGWKKIQAAKHDKHNIVKKPYIIPEIWEKQNLKLGYTLIKTEIAYQKQEWSLQKMEKSIPLENVSWADFDQNGRLIMARYGALLMCDLAQEPLTATLLVDLNNQKPPQIVHRSILSKKNQD